MIILKPGRLFVQQKVVIVVIISLKRFYLLDKLLQATAIVCEKFAFQSGWCISCSSNLRRRTEQT